MLIAVQEKEVYLWANVNVHAVPKPLITMCATYDTSDPKSMYFIYVCEKVNFRFHRTKPTPFLTAPSPQVEVDPAADVSREEKMAVIKDLKWDPNK